MDKHTLTLFILGYTPAAKRAIKNLENLCVKSEICSFYTFKVINLFDYPEYAEQEKILATPLLIIKNSHENIRIIGDLSKTEQVYAVLTNGLMSHEEKKL